MFNILFPYHSTFRSSFWCFFLYVEHQVEPPHLLTFGVIYCICGQPLNPRGTRFLCCSHGGGMDYIPWHGSKCFCLHWKRHGVSCDQTHVLSPASLQSSRELVDIMLLIDGICTLANVIIINPTQVDLVSQTTSFHRVVTKMVTQAKEGFYHNQHPINTFFSLTIEVFGCIHQQAYDFLHRCASMAWSPKGTNGLPLIILLAFYRWKMSIALQKVRIAFILRHIIIASEGSSRFTGLSSFSSLSSDLLVAIGRGLGT